MNALLEHHMIRVQTFMREQAGVVIADSKRPMVNARLHRRLTECGFDNFSTYLNFALEDPQESKEVIHLLTTHETYFFREKHHLDMLREYVRARPAQATRVWSAACSSGEEAFSAAMVLCDELGMHRSWSVLGSDVSEPVVEKARRGVYPLQRLEHMDPQFLHRFCQEGRGNSQGLMRVRQEIRDRVEFRTINLLGFLPGMEPFDAIFLRNVLIYFTVPDQKRVIESVSRFLKPDGLLLLGKAEMLRGTPCPGLRRDGPSVWRRGP